KSIKKLTKYFNDYGVFVISAAEFHITTIKLFLSCRYGLKISCKSQQSVESERRQVLFRNGCGVTGLRRSTRNPSLHGTGDFSRDPRVAGGASNCRRTLRTYLSGADRRSYRDLFSGLL